MRINGTSGNVGIGTTAPTHKLNVVGNMNLTGNFSGNQFYGEIYNFSSSGVTHAIAGADAYINITTGTREGEMNGFSFSGGKATTIVPGLYRFSHGMSFNGGNGDEYHSTVGVDGISQNKCHAVRDAGSAAKTGSVSRTCLIRLTVGNVVTFMVENDMDADDVVIEDFNLNWWRIGN